jgi:hypothetical protein
LPVLAPTSPIPHFNPRNPALDIDERSDSYEMVQTYGVVPETSLEPSLDMDEAGALLADSNVPGTPSKSDRHTDGHATLTSCISNLSNTIIGSGAYFTITRHTRLTSHLIILRNAYISFGKPLSISYNNYTYIQPLVYRQWVQQG